jgi:ubiquinone/menaquinone biosynthesis C-methylase UbiE
MHDIRKVFEEIDLEKGDIVLDLGCGPGDYTIESARIVGRNGLVYALDREEDLLCDLDERAGNSGIGNIKTIFGDITMPLPIDSGQVDVCLMITVLHIPGVLFRKETMFPEIRRVLKRGGQLITIDVKKEDPSFGPPLHMRIASEELESIVAGYGFKKVGQVDLGCNYMMKFTAEGTKG